MFGGNMQGMMKKVQKMQKEMKKLQDDLKKRTVEATVGGGVLTIVMMVKRMSKASTSTRASSTRKMQKCWKTSWSQPSMKPTRKSTT